MPWDALLATPMPVALLRAVAGESACVVLDSTRCAPERLVGEASYRFEYADIDAALASWACNVPVLGTAELLLRSVFGAAIDYQDLQYKS